MLSLVFFLVEFLTHPAHGLPDLPPTLIALSGFAAAGYTTKKGLAGVSPKPGAASTPAPGPTAAGASGGGAKAASGAGEPS
ncbi:MAG: hypothetical protein QOE58_625 [Actinomycetota bacterium]|nr:hypothetical protein [Actinomycetota bacterium]